MLSSFLLVPIVRSQIANFKIRAAACATTAIARDGSRAHPPEFTLDRLVDRSKRAVEFSEIEYAVANQVSRIDLSPFQSVSTVYFSRA